MTISQFPQRVTVHKRRAPGVPPLISVILLDWSVRERFHTLEWLSRQSVPREQYELIWVEVYERVMPIAMKRADVVITCGQRGIYHKSAGLNVGLLHASGVVVTVSQSDEVYPPDFVESVVTFFRLRGGGEPAPLVLMHHERRSLATYPPDLGDVRELDRYPWLPLWPNVGACISMLRRDAIRFGGFDEHASFRGYLCGPDLHWRLVNAGMPEVWHDESVCLWHFAHPEPNAHQGAFSFRRWREIRYPHIDFHPLTAIEAFSTGRLLPLWENPDVHRLRLEQRRIGTAFETRYAWMTGPDGFPRRVKVKLHCLLIAEPFKRMFRFFLWRLGRAKGARGRAYRAVRDTVKVLIRRR